MNKNYLKLKRVLDVVFSIIFLILLLPFLFLIAIFIKFDSKGNILFKQKRVGKDNKEFVIYKFRTMYIDAPSEQPTHLLVNPDLMITSIGKILRKASLDELPQLINILNGDMSFIGPRPALWNQKDLINLRTQKGIHLILPGLTGFAQINGRDELDIITKVEYDYIYFKNINLFFDIKCILGTIKNVLQQKNIVEGDNKK